MKGVVAAVAVLALLCGPSAAIAQSQCITGNYLILLVDQHTLALRQLLQNGNPMTDPTSTLPMCYPAGTGNTADPIIVRARTGSTIPQADLKVVVRDAEPYDGYRIVGSNFQNPNLLRIRVIPDPPAGIDLKYDILVKDVGVLDPVIRVRELDQFQQIRTELEASIGPPVDPATLGIDPSEYEDSGS